MAIEVSQSMLTALQTALGSRTLSITHNGKSTTYRSFDEIIKQIEWIEKRLASSTDRPRTTYIKRVG